MGGGLEEGRVQGVGGEHGCQSAGESVWVLQTVVSPSSWVSLSRPCSVSAPCARIDVEPGKRADEET